MSSPPAALSGANARSTADFDVAVIYERQIDIPAERERLIKELARLKKILDSTESQLNNSKAFIAKAPGHIVDSLRKQYHPNTKSSTTKRKAISIHCPPPKYPETEPLIKPSSNHQERAFAFDVIVPAFDAIASALGAIASAFGAEETPSCSINDIRFHSDHSSTIFPPSIR